VAKNSFSHFQSAVVMRTKYNISLQLRCGQKQLFTLPISSYDAAKNSFSHFQSADVVMRPKYNFSHFQSAAVMRPKTAFHTSNQQL
jgi:hypothetical protein